MRLQGLQEVVWDRLVILQLQLAVERAEVHELTLLALEFDTAVRCHLGHPSIYPLRLRVAEVLDREVQV